MARKTLNIVTLLLTILLSACGSTNGLTKAEREALVTRQVQECLDTRHYTIAVDWMKPLGGFPRQVSSNYDLTVNGDEIDCYLPYIGEAYHLPYGGGKGLNFSAPIESYRESQPKDDRRHIEISLTNDEDTYQYIIDIFTNGSANIDVIPRERDRITYYGELDFK